MGSTTIGDLNSLPHETIYNTRKSWYTLKKQQGDPNAGGWLNRLAQLPATIAA
jgi:hypothetical protein